MEFQSYAYGKNHPLIQPPITMLVFSHTWPKTGLRTIRFR